jgi:hypothetical protein
MGLELSSGWRMNVLRVPIASGAAVVTELRPDGARGKGETVEGRRDVSWWDAESQRLKRLTRRVWRGNPRNWLMNRRFARHKQ